VRLSMDEVHNGSKSELSGLIENARA